MMATAAVGARAGAGGAGGGGPFGSQSLYDGAGRATQLAAYARGS